jgi:hypothetical protein
MIHRPDTSYELQFSPLAPDAPALAFPCDACGVVDMDSLSDGERHAYLYARAVMGRELARPQVQAVALH